MSGRYALADKLYGISTLSVDEMAAASFQGAVQYFKDLKETNRWSVRPGEVWIETKTQGCEKGILILRATHGRSGRVFRSAPPLPAQDRQHR